MSDPSDSSGNAVQITSRDKVYFRDAGVSKGDLADYYQSIATCMLPHTRRYGATLQRFPDGIEEDGFFNKDAPDYFPEWIQTTRMPKKEGGSYDAPVVNSEDALLYLVNQGMITPHLYLAPIEDAHRPDKMVFDLDPPEGTTDYAEARQAAQRLHETLDSFDMTGWVQTTGSNGYHVIVPIRSEMDFDDVRECTRSLARIIVNKEPDRFTLEQRKDKRNGRVFVDTLRNAFGSTFVAPYSVRPRKDASVAAPIEWNELDNGTNPRDWNVTNILRRMGQRRDPWADIRRHAVSLKSRRDDIRAAAGD